VCTTADCTCTCARRGSSATFALGITERSLRAPCLPARQTPPGDHACEATLHRGGRWRILCGLRSMHSVSSARPPASQPANGGEDEPLVFGHTFNITPIAFPRRNWVQGGLPRNTGHHVRIPVGETPQPSAQCCSRAHASPVG
jgi:hypothetical protein